MRMQRRLLASCTPLVLPWNQPQVIAYLVGRPTLKVKYVTPSSTAFTTLRRGMQKMQAQCEHIRPRWSAQERLRLNASVRWEGTTNISDLITLMSASLTLLRCLARESLQGEIQLCQK